MNGRPVTTVSAGPGPFGAIALGSDRILVSEAAPEMPLLASVSTYQIDAMGRLMPITAALPNGQTASCWEVVTPDGQYAFTSNSGNGTISSYMLAADGSVTLLEGAAQTPGSAPIDMSLAPDGSMLYVLLGASGEIAAYPVTSGVLGVAKDEGVVLALAVSATRQAARPTPARLSGGGPGPAQVGRVHRVKAGSSP